MNWNSNSVDAVAKERIWKEHVLNEKNTARVHDQFRCNPLRKDPPTAESISKRPARFLDRSAVVMDMLQKRLQRANNKNNTKNDGENNTTARQIDTSRYFEFSQNNNKNNDPAASISGRSQIQQNFQLQSRGMYSFNDSANPRGMQAKDKLPPLNNNTNNNAATLAGTTTSSASNNNNNLASPRTKRSLAAHDFDGLYSQAQLTPREKYAVPQTAMQEIGWWNQNLISHKELEPRFRYGLSSCDVTKNGSAFVGSRRN
jgi:hypothetical protein